MLGICCQEQPRNGNTLPSDGLSHLCTLPGPFGFRIIKHHALIKYVLTGVDDFMAKNGHCPDQQVSTWSSTWIQDHPRAKQDTNKEVRKQDKKELEFTELLNCELLASFESQVLIPVLNQLYVSC